MAMRDILLIAMYITIFGLLIESWVVFNHMKTHLHAYLLISCIATLINNVGYLMQITSHSEEAYMTALRFSYVGRVWIAFSLFMFTAELCRVTIPGEINKLLILINIGIFAVILTMDRHRLYYTDTRFEVVGMFPRLIHRNGIFHHIFVQITMAYIFIALYWLFRAIIKEKSRQTKRRLWMIVAIVIIEGGCFSVQVFRLNYLLESFDFSMIGLLFGMIIMYIAIFRYNLLGITEIAREFMIDRLKEGVIAVDNDDEVRYFNKPALRLYPEIKEKPGEALSDIRAAISKGDTIFKNGRYYTPEENDMKSNGEYLGKLYALVDATELKEKEYQLKSDAAILEMAASSMRERLLTAEEMVQQDRAMRHDRRHFEALLMSLLQDGKTDEVKKCLEERLAQEPRTARRFCENTTVNAAITHYVSMAERKDIEVQVSTTIPADTGTDEMKLAIVISNLLENAIHACEKMPEKERFINIKAKYKEQLLIEISNSCEKEVPLDEDGHPYSTKGGHGIGTKSVLAFVNETGSEIRYIAEERSFKVRMMIG